MTALWKWTHSNEFANSHKPSLVKKCLQNKKTLICWKSKTYQRVKSKKSKASQFDVSVGAVNNILKRKREYENLGDPLG